MRVVLDTSAIIYLNDFRNFDEMFVVEEVVKEVKDRTSMMKLPGLKFKVAEPLKKTVDEIKDVAGKTGDLEKLSDTDVKVLALAKDTNSTIVSDDRNIQNVAEKLGIKYISIFSKKITKLITWKNYCKSCKKFFEKKVCPVCGSELARVPKKAVELN